MEYYDYMMTENQQQEMNEAQANFDNYMIGCIVGFLNMNNVGEFVHNPTEETVYDNVEGYYLTYDEVRTLEKEVGPIKYVAQLLFGGDSKDLLDKAVQVFILMLVFVFDPLAVMLVIAANQTLLRYGINLEKTGPDLRDELKDERPDLPRQPSPPSAVDDAADVMSGYTAPAPVIVEKEVIKEVPVEVIKEVEKVVEKEVEAEIDLSTPPAIKELEKRLEKKLNKDGKKDNS